jgi:nicotinamidase-related amidase
MRLPVDATLIVMTGASADEDVEALLAAWRRERLPIFHVRREPGDAPEPVIVALADDAFAKSDLEAALDAIGATTLVIVGARGPAAATARAAAGRGYRVFVVANAPLVEAEAAKMATLETALAAARGARWRERWQAARRAALLKSEKANSEG